MFLVQIMDPARRATLMQMADAVVKIAEQRDGNRRFAAYSFDNDLTLLADFDAPKRDFERQVRAVKASRCPLSSTRRASMPSPSSPRRRETARP